MLYLLIVVLACKVIYKLACNVELACAHRSTTQLTVNYKDDLNKRKNIL